MVHQIVIVLGNRNKEIMEKRANTAINYYNTTKINDMKEELVEYFYVPTTMFFIFSGGSCDGVSKPEGAVMLSEFAKGKLPEEYCHVEKESQNTFQNLTFSKKYIETRLKGLAFCTNPTIVICTSTFHTKRSVLMARLIFDNYIVKFIHTNEEITEDEKKSEEKNILDFVDSYVKL